MMSTEILFCDTYALIEIIGGNPAYKKYLQNTLVTSDYNIMELYYALLRDYDKLTAEKYFIEWSKFCIIIPREIIKEAMHFKLENKKENLSYVDCMGYAFALQNGIRFLTGDIKFKDRKSVEWAQ